MCTPCPEDADGLFPSVQRLHHRATISCVSLPSCPWIENSSQQRSLPASRLALILPLQLTPCLQPFTLVDQLDNSKRLSFKFHHEDCVQLSRDRLNFCLMRCFQDWQSRRCCCIQLSSPTDQLAPGLKLENPLWPMFTSPEYGAILNSHRVSITDTAILFSIHRDSAITMLRYHVLIVDWG